MTVDIAVVNAVVIDGTGVVNTVDNARVASTVARMTWRDVEGGDFAWREAGDGPDVVVCLHGLGGSSWSWDAQLHGLGERCRIAAWDLPGYGRSAPPDAPFTFAWLADAVARFADELGAPTFHLVGISFGGMIAQYAAAAHPHRVRTLTLLATSPKFGLDGTEPDAWRAARLAPLDAGLEPAEFADRVLGALAGPHITAEAMAGQHAAMERITGDALRRSIEVLVAHDSRPVLPAVVAPTVCLAGELDDETPVSYAQAIVDLVPGARLQVVPGAGHLLNAEAPDVVNAAIAAQIEARIDGAHHERSRP
jgi:pimeloyl-ACP methyl ester carboxylesterase